MQVIPGSGARHTAAVSARSGRRLSAALGLGAGPSAAYGGVLLGLAVGTSCGCRRVQGRHFVRGEGGAPPRIVLLGLRLSIAEVGSIGLKACRSSLGHSAAILVVGYLGGDPAPDRLASPDRGGHEHLRNTAIVASGAHHRRQGGRDQTTPSPASRSSACSRCSPTRRRALAFGGNAWRRGCSRLLGPRHVAGRCAAWSTRSTSIPQALDVCNGHELERTCPCWCDPAHAILYHRRSSEGTAAALGTMVPLFVVASPHEPAANRR